MRCGSGDGGHLLLPAAAAHAAAVVASASATKNGGTERRDCNIVVGLMFLVPFFSDSR